MASVLKVDTIKSLAGNEAITISESGDVSFATPPTVPVPAFHVRRSGNQTGVPSGTSTLIQFNAIEFDTDGYWSESADTPPGLYRYKPLIPGYYQFNASMYGIGTNDTRTYVAIHKNGSDTGARSDVGVASATIALSILTTSHLIYLNGVDDYVDARGFIGPATDAAFGSFYTMFSGFLVRAA